MAAFVITFLVGVACIVLGCVSRTGNISVLHSYHIKRVRAEDRLPFGRKVGLGMMILGGGIIVFSILAVIALALERMLFMWIGLGIMGAGMILGMGICFKATIRYNKGIF